MIRENFAKLAQWYKDLTPTAKSMVWLSILLIIGIIIRWDATMEGIERGFGFFKK
ncbi:MAG: hypothetical protein IKW15_06430 [Bacteroidales bacterium]|nr:hypothetical protein [Bacteroidales bacterium]